MRKDNFTGGMRSDNLSGDRTNDRISKGGLRSDEAVSLYIIVFFLMFIIAVMSMWQTRRSDLLRREIDALKRQAEVATEQRWTSDP
jgi:hypothetical protein